MAVSYLFRSTYRQRQPSQLQRRWNVVFFILALLVALAEGGLPWRAHTFLPRALPYLALLPILLHDRPTKRQGGVYVTSLDDRAMLKYGAEYESLSSEQQKDILDHYRVGTYIVPRASDDVQARKRDHRCYLRQAYRVYRWGALPLALLYGAGWKYLPGGYVRTVWTNGPVIAGVLIASVLALPTLLTLWNAPERA